MTMRLAKTTVLRLAAAACCGWFAFGGPLHAQEALRDEAGAIQRRQQDLLEQERRAQRLREAEEAARQPTLQAPGAPLLDIPPELRDYRFEVKRIALDPSVILSAEELESVTRRYTGREIAFQELSSLIGDLNALYAQKRMLARAVLPPQQITDGVLTVRLIEARIGDVKLSGNASTADGYITRRVDIARDEPVALDALRDALVDFNLRNDVMLRAQLTPGASFGTTDIVLQAIEPPRWEAMLGFDNAGTEAVGEERVALNATVRSLTRHRDRLITAGVFTEGSKTGSVLFDLPVWRRGTRLGAGFDASDISIENGPLAAADVTGSASTLTLQATHPLLARPDLRIDGLLAYRAKHSSTEFFDVEIANVTVRSLEASVSATKFDASGTWYTQHGLTSGIDGIGSDNSFLVYRGDVQRWQRLWNDALLRLSVQGQWADIDLLPPAEQFQLGGRYSVRGFREGLLIGDTGYLVSAELRKPLPPPALGTLGRYLAGRVTGKLFVDHGGAFPYKGAGVGIGAEDYLTSAGFGFDLIPFAGTSAQLAWSFPLGFRDDREDYRFIFQLQVGLPQIWR